MAREDNLKNISLSPFWQQSSLSRSEPCKLSFVKLIDIIISFEVNKTSTVLYMSSNVHWISFHQTHLWESFRPDSVSYPKHKHGRANPGWPIVSSNNTPTESVLLTPETQRTFDTTATCVLDWHDCEVHLLSSIEPIASWWPNACGGGAHASERAFDLFTITYQLEISFGFSASVCLPVCLSV